MKIDEYITENIDESGIDSLKKFQEENNGSEMQSVFRILYATDLHYNHKNELHMGSLKKLREMVEYSRMGKIDLLLLTGDLTNGRSEISDIMHELSVITDELKKAEAPVMICKGNHDSNTWYAAENHLDRNGWISNEQWYKNVVEKTSEKLVADADNICGGYGYMDFPSKKLRVICLNTSDIPDVLDDDGRIVDEYCGQTCLGMSERQLRWLVETLQFEEEGWSVIFASHNVPCDAAITRRRVYNGQIAWEIIRAFKNKQAVNFKNDEKFFEAEVQCDFRNNKSSDVLVYIYGHNHMDKQMVYDGITTICTKDMMNAVVTADDGTVYCASLKDIPVICDEPVKNNPNAHLEGGWEYIEIDIHKRTFSSKRFALEEKNRFIHLE